MLARSVLAAVAALSSAAAAVPAPASAMGRDPDGLLPSLPRNAAPGVCYARVKAPATMSPPGPAHARWKLTPPPPGAPGPLWCLVTEPGSPPVVIAPERSGWIRVLCDADATPTRITGLQRRLRAHGMYEGDVSGRYDAATAAAVARFQGARRLDHGGYLSLRTMEALESGPLGAPVVVSRASTPLPPPPPPPPVVTIPVPQPYPVYAPPRCCARPAIPYGVHSGEWLSWPGKSRF